MRKLVEEMTGLHWFEPGAARDMSDYENPDFLIHKPGHFYSWHLVLNDAVQHRLMEMNAKVILVTRNIYDLAVSMYYHFANDVDHEIGRSTRTAHYFQSISKDEGLMQIIRGHKDQNFVWDGIGWHLKQMQLLLEFAKKHKCCLISFEQLSLHREEIIGKLASYLGIQMVPDRIREIAGVTSFDAMKTETQGASHFRKGKVFSHADDLKPSHMGYIELEMQKWAPQLADLSRLFGIKETIYCFPAGLSSPVSL